MDRTIRKFFTSERKRVKPTLTKIWKDLDSIRRGVISIEEKTKITLIIQDIVGIIDTCKSSTPAAFNRWLSLHFTEAEIKKLGGKSRGKQ